jgi:hypothetical protein
VEALKPLDPRPYEGGRIGTSKYEVGFQVQRGGDQVQVELRWIPVELAVQVARLVAASGNWS